MIHTNQTNANHLLNTLITRLRLKNDAALARGLRVAPPVLSKIRHGKIEIGPTILMRMHEITGLQIAYLRDLLNGNDDIELANSVDTAHLSGIFSHKNENISEINDQSFDESDIDAGRLLDSIIDMLNLKNDAALCRVLDVAPPVISKIRHGKLALGAAMLVRLQELTGVSIPEMRRVMAKGRLPLSFVTPHAAGIFAGQNNSYATRAHFNYEVPDFEPNRLLDGLVSKLKLKSDEELCKALEIELDDLKKIRSRRESIKAPLLIRIQEVGAFNENILRMLMTDRRKRQLNSDS